jgi:hypothetical protein
MKRPRADPEADAEGKETKRPRTDPSADAEGKEIWLTFTQMAQRMAFYAGVYKRGRFTIPLHEAREYGRQLPAAIGREHLHIEGGAMPRLLTPEVVRALVAEE